MAENSNSSKSGQDASQLNKTDRTIGNQQGTAQTGAQNAGGENIDQAEDQYTDDLRKSGDRHGSNRKAE